MDVAHLTTDLSDDALRALLLRAPERGWRAFVDQYTPLLLSLIAREGVSDRDHVGDVYLRVCERLAANGAERLRRHDPRKGALAAWLTVVVRHVVVDWVRSRAGRRRLFRGVTRLDRFDQRVFELYYWEHRRASEIAERLGAERQQRVNLGDVLDALQRIDDAMTDHHRRRLLTALARTTPAVSLDTGAVPPSEVQEPRADPEQALRVRQLDELFAAALASLPAEDAAIVRLTFVQGWTRDQIRRALHLDELSRDRLTAILDRLRSILRARQVGLSEAATPGLRFLESR